MLRRPRREHKIGGSYCVVNPTRLLSASRNLIDEYITFPNSQASSVYQGSDIPPSPTSEAKLFFRISK